MKKNIQTLGQKGFWWVGAKLSELKKEIKKLIKRREEVFSKIKKIDKENRTFENTIFALEKNNRELSDFLVKLDVLTNMSPKKNIREGSSKISLEASMKLIEINFDQGVYEAVNDYVKGNFKKEKLEEVDKKLVKEYFREYKRMGFALPEKEQEKLKKINKKISELSQKFSLNINNWEDFILLDPTKNETAGLNNDFLKSLKKEKGLYRVSLDYPELNPFLENSELESKREEILKKASKKGGKENLKLLNQIIDLKKEKAGLLGYKNYPDYVVEDRMAKKSENVINFFESLLEKIKKLGREEIKILEKFKKDFLGNKKVKLKPHDIAFFSTKLKKERYQIDEDDLRNYFSLEDVKKEMFKVFSNLFDFEIKKNKRIKLWSDEVEFYDIYLEGQKISHLALDLFPRKGKYGHAAMWDLEYGYQKDLDSLKRKAPMSLVVCNFARPQKNRPSLLSHDEIQTLFHEFGHALHHALSQAKHASHFGVSVAWDFVETPSQLLENWAWDKEFLKKVGRHWKTGERLSEEKILNLIKSRNFMEKYGKLRQIIMTKIDFDLHLKKIKNPAEFWKKVFKRYTGMDVYKESLMPAGFGHIVGGYDAGYYSYLWALVYSDDIFSLFEKEGVHNKKVGKKYLKEILQRGSSVDELEMVKNFLGRKSNSKAFLKKLF